MPARFPPTHCYSEPNASGTSASKTKKLLQKKKLYESFGVWLAPERVVGVRPDLGHVERVEAAPSSLLEAHDLKPHEKRKKENGATKGSEACKIGVSLCFLLAQNKPNNMKDPHMKDLAKNCKWTLTTYNRAQLAFFCFQYVSWHFFRLSHIQTPENNNSTTTVGWHAHSPPTSFVDKSENQGTPRQTSSTKKHKRRGTHVKPNPTKNAAYMSRQQHSTKKKKRSSD